jgi:hypothetical protein
MVRLTGEQWERIRTRATNHHEVRLVQPCFDFYRENLISNLAYDSVGSIAASDRRQLGVLPVELPGLCSARLLRYSLQA